jgi:hypothetical protein
MIVLERIAAALVTSLDEQVAWWLPSHRQTMPRHTDNIVGSENRLLQLVAS